VKGTAANDAIHGEAGNDKLRGQGGRDRLEGGAGNDSLYGGTGSDLLVGGLGNDRFDVDGSGDRVFESAGEGTDTVYATRSYTLQAGQEIEALRAVSRTAKTAMSLAGNEFANLVVGNDGTNTIRGGGGDDRLFGHGGNDRLAGGAGVDSLFGGTGRDAFVFNTVPDAGSNVDRIGDFSVRDDTIQLENAVLTALGRKTGGLKTSAFHVGGAAHDSSDRVIYNKNTGALYYDPDGTGSSAQIQLAQLKSGLAMRYEHFFVV
jgi:Ca2+-binding RTX toxin-like protein